MVGMMNSKPAPGEAEAAADSVAVVDTTGQAGNESELQSTETNSEDSTVRVQPAVQHKPVAVASEPVVPTPGPVIRRAEPSNESAKKLARIFSAMQATDAAAVLGHLSDSDVMEIITQLGTRQAAAIIASLPEQRAARISRLLLRRRLEAGGGG